VLKTTALPASVAFFGDEEHTNSRWTSMYS